MNHIFKVLLAIVVAESPIYAQQPVAKTTQEEIIALEKSFAEAIKSRDTIQTKKMQAETYFLAVGVKGQPLRIIPRNRWFNNLKAYVIESYSIDDIKVNIYGNIAVALLLLTQQATTGGEDRSAQFVLTDIWMKDSNSWLIAERHSSRPESPLVK
jgi:ketosteroid isomerase-like protein